MLDDGGYNKMQQITQLARDALDNNRFSEATAIWEYAEGAVLDYAYVDFYNILTKMEFYSKSFDRNRGNLLLIHK